MLSEERQKKMHLMGANNYASWLMSARELDYSSKLLIWRSMTFNRRLLKKRSKLKKDTPISPDTTSVIQMLRHMALECLMKGIICKSGEKLVDEETCKYNFRIKDHDLLKYADYLKKKNLFRGLEETEEDLLTHLNTFNEIGRYPVTSTFHKSGNKLVKKEKNGDTEITPLGMSCSEDTKTYNKLYKNLSACLE